MHHLAELYIDQERYTDAERLLRRAIQIRKKSCGRDHGDTAASLETLARLCWLQKRYSEANPLRAEAVRIARKSLGEEHPDTLTYMFNQAVDFTMQHRFAEAEASLRKVLRMQIKTYDRHHGVSESRNLCTSMRALANVYQQQGRSDEAEDLIEQAHVIGGPVGL